MLLALASYASTAHAGIPRPSDSAERRASIRLREASSVPDQQKECTAEAALACCCHPGGSISRMAWRKLFTRAVRSGVGGGAPIQRASSQADGDVPRPADPVWRVRSEGGRGRRATLVHQFDSAPPAEGC